MSSRPDNIRSVLIDRSVDIGPTTRDATIDHDVMYIRAAAAAAAATAACVTGVSTAPSYTRGLRRSLNVITGTCVTVTVSCGYYIVKYLSVKPCHAASNFSLGLSMGEAQFRGFFALFTAASQMGGRDWGEPLQLNLWLPVAR